ncbi:hypothetical protein HMPREF9374_0410 [Desmospora sp. 8437]|nr:hypothetical protein HMPREF9374_0410 [Desmospora sp. 8437]
MAVSNPRLVKNLQTEITVKTVNIKNDHNQILIGLWSTAYHLTYTFLTMNHYINIGKALKRWFF